MTIQKLAALDPREAFDSVDEAAFYMDDENSFLACYLDGMAAIDDMAGDDESEFFGGYDA